MTQNTPHEDDVDEAILAFVAACPIPSESDLEAWCLKHPDHAAAMRDYAEVARENFETHEPEDAEEQAELDAMADRVFARGMTLIQAERRTSLPELIASKGTTIPKVAAAIGIDRGVLADIVAGRLLPPVGPRLVAALSAALGSAGQAVRQAVAASFDAPRVGYASSEAQTAVRARTWAESVAASDMAADRKAYWLGED